MVEKIILEIDDIMWKNPITGNHEIFEIIIKRKGIWEFHKNDQDPFPSQPHGHNRETGEKLDIYTGKKYDPRTRKGTGMLPRKFLLKIQDDLKRKLTFTNSSLVH